MNIAPLQHFGLGDVIFCQNIINEWIELGHDVTWGVLPHYVEGLNRAYTKIKFVDYKELPIDYNIMGECDMNGYRVIPLRWSVELLGFSYDLCMLSKYYLFNKDYRDWKKGSMFKRDANAEARLMELLGLNTNDDYILVNSTYGSEFGFRVNIPISRDVRVIEMRNIQGFSLFDWVGVLIHAKEIHTVSSSLFYILELLDFADCEIYLYNRHNDKYFKHIDYLFTKQYNLKYVW